MSYFDYLLYNIQNNSIKRIDIITRNMKLMNSGNQNIKFYNPHHDIIKHPGPYLSLGKIREIFEALKTNISVTELFIYNSEDLFDLSAELSDLFAAKKNFKSLYLRRISLKQEFPNLIESMINAEIEYYSFSEVEFPKNLTGAHLSKLISTKPINALLLRRSFIAKEDMTLIIEATKDNPFIEYFSLCHEPILSFGQIAQSIIELLKENTTLIHLDLSYLTNWKMDLEIFKEFSLALANNKSLKTINLLSSFPNYNSAISRSEAMKRVFYKPGQDDEVVTDKSIAPYIRTIIEQNIYLEFILLNFDKEQDEIDSIINNGKILFMDNYYEQYKLFSEYYKKAPFNAEIDAFEIICKYIANIEIPADEVVKTPSFIDYITKFYINKETEGFLNKLQLRILLEYLEAGKVPFSEGTQLPLKSIIEEEEIKAGFRNAATEVNGNIIKKSNDNSAFSSIKKWMSKVIKSQEESLGKNL